MQKTSDLLPPTLRRVLSECPKMTIAFSGGLDSRFLCHAAQLCECKVMTVHITGPHVPDQESALAEAWARKHLIPYTSVYFNPLALPEIAVNAKDRCYFCKKVIFGKIIDAMGENNAFPLCDGGNRDDMGEYRPGRQAADETGVLSPLALAGLGKNEIKYLAKLTGLENPYQRARPCLLTRFAYGIKPTIEKLELLERIENRINSLLKNAGLNEMDFRLRFLPEPELHISAMPATIAQSVKKLLKEEGMADCSIKKLDRVSGYHDKKL